MSPTCRFTRASLPRALLGWVRRAGAAARHTSRVHPDRDPNPDADPDPYRVLGVPPGADATAVRTAYLAAVRRWHPDRDPSPQAAEQFLAVQRAWESLGDGAGTGAVPEDGPPAWMRELAEGAAAAYVAARRGLRRGLGFDRD